MSGPDEPVGVGAGRGRRGRAGRRRAIAAAGRGAAASPPPTGPAQADGTGPAGAGCGPYLVGALALTSLNQASPKAVMSSPSAAVNASSSVRPCGVRADERDERVAAVRPDHVVDRADALRVGEEEVLAVRELAGQAVERDERAGLRGGLVGAPVVRAVALALVDRQALVEPARRRVVRVRRGRVEHEVDELVRDPDGDQRIVDLVGRDEPEQRPDVGERRPGDVLVGARPERAVEVVVVRVDEEVDRFGLGHAEQLRRVADLVLAELERLGAERGVALVPVDPDEVAGHGLPVEPVVRVDDLDLRAEDAVLRVRRREDAPARLDRRVRDHVVLAARVERVGQRVRPGDRRDRDLGDVRADRVGDRQQQLDPDDRLVDGDRLAEVDAGLERGRRGRRPERRVRPPRPRARG